MIFRKSGNISYTWLYDENHIEIVNTICYLGIVFSYTFLSFLGNSVSFSTTMQERCVLFEKQNQTFF